MRPLLLGLLLVLAACAGRGRPATDPTAFSCYAAPNLAQVQRVVVVPLWRAQGVGRSALVLDEALATSLRELGRFEVMRLSEADRDELLGTDAVAANSVPSDALRRIFQRHRADAVLIGRIEHLHSYDPVAIGLATHLVSCLDGTVLWSASGHFDGARHDVQTDLRAWHDATVGDNVGELGGWQAALSSPRLFARYVSDRVAASVLAPPPSANAIRPGSHPLPR